MTVRTGQSQPARLRSLQDAAADLPPLPPANRRYQLGLNENPYPPPPELVTAAFEALMASNRYPEPAGTRLRTALAELLGVDPDRITAGAGLVALCRSLVQALVDVDDEVVFPWPSFDDYLIDTILHDARPVPVPFRGTDVDLHAVLDRISPRTRLVLLASPNNPTGAVLAHDELDRFLGAVPPGVVVAIDEAYAEFATLPGRADGLELLRGHPGLVVLRTFSKAYGLAGLRVGYAVSDATTAARLQHVLAPFGVSRPAEAAAVAALEHRDSIMRRAREIITERDRVARRLAEMGWPVARSQANFLWLPLRESAADVAAQLARHDIAVRPYLGLGIRVTVGLRAESDVLLSAMARIRHSVPRTEHQHE